MPFRLVLGATVQLTLSPRQLRLRLGLKETLHYPKPHRITAARNIMVIPFSAWIYRFTESLAQ